MSLGHQPSQIFDSHMIPHAPNQNPPTTISNPQSSGQLPGNEGPAQARHTNQPPQQDDIPPQQEDPLSSTSIDLASESPVARHVQVDFTIENSSTDTFDLVVANTCINESAYKWCDLPYNLRNISMSYLCHSLIHAVKHLRSSRIIHNISKNHNNPN